MPNEELRARYERGLELKLAIDNADAQASPFLDLRASAPKSLEAKVLRYRANQTQELLADLRADLQLARDLDAVACYCGVQAEKFLLSVPAQMTPREIHVLANKRPADVKAILRGLMRDSSEQIAAAWIRDRLFFLGPAIPKGTYVLRIHVPAWLRMTFGHFRHSKRILVPAGDYLYVGSAMDETGPVCLGNRLIRHATRTGEKPAHPIRHAIMRVFPAGGLGKENLAPPRDGKHFKWNIDHLVDRSEVELTAAYLIRSETKLEARVGKALELDAGTVVIERGLGAGDIPGNTHLLLVNADEDWWDKLPGKLNRLLHAFGNS